MSTRWREQPERGSQTGIELLMLMTDRLGREFVWLVLWPVCVYFALVAANARRASQAYLRRMQVPPSFSNVVRHLHAFAQVAADRYLFLAGEVGEFEVRHHGHEHMLEVGRSPRGALLLGSHVGSFEAMRSLAEQHDFSLSVVADFGNAAKINGMFARHLPHMRLDIIEAEPTNTLWMLQVKERIEQGKLVAMLADRLNGDGARGAEVELLGGVARLPTGPFVLAHILECPVVLVFALFDGERGYDLYCEPLAERVRLPRRERDLALREWAQRYADRIEHHVRLAPFNWFNFFDYWLPVASDRPSPSSPSDHAHE